MSEIKHMPGPWKLIPREVLEDGSVYPTHLVSGPHEYQVCVLESTTIAELAVSNPEKGWGIGEENARLIEAAPELLQAAQILVELFEKVAIGNVDNGISFEAGVAAGRLNEYISEARAAIAKATGAA
jgi:hypothetical protein